MGEKLGGEMNRWSTAYFWSSDTILYDTLMVAALHSFVKAHSMGKAKREL